MEKYIFVLGRDVELSYIELVSYFSKKNISYNIIDGYQNLLILELDGKFDINELGGLIKIAEVIEDIEPFLRSLDLNKNKILYSVNDEKIKEKLKQKFKQEGIKAIYKSEVKDLNLSSKMDLELIKFKNYLARVIQTSNPRGYKLRDELRPYFDAKKVTSIRLAKILINLSQAKKELLDPFCGQGTIMQESLLLGLNCFGIDIKVKEAKENLVWLKKNFNFKPKYKLFQGDSKRLSKYFRKVECCVTEPYLGPYFKNYPNYDEALSVIKDLGKLYSRVFQELDKIIERKVVILLPVIKTNIKKKLNLSINNLIKNTKFKVAEFDKIKLPLIYSNKGAIVEREIWVLEKSNL